MTTDRADAERRMYPLGAIVAKKGVGTSVVPVDDLRGGIENGWRLATILFPVWKIECR